MGLITQMRIRQQAIEETKRRGEGHKAIDKAIALAIIYLADTVGNGKRLT